jgi:hypothetical protein
VAEALVCKTSLSGFESRRYLQKKKGPDHISCPALPVPTFEGSTTLFNNLPQINQGRFLTVRHLQSSFAFHDGLDRRLHDSAAPQFHTT